MANDLNVGDLREQVGGLQALLTQEKEARAAAVSDLEAANAAHASEIESLKAAHAGELESAKSAHVKELAAATGQLETANARIAELEAEATTASQQGAAIAAQVGGDPVDPDGDSDPTAQAPLTEAEHKKLLAEQAALPVDQRHGFYLEKIRPRLNQ